MIAEPAPAKINLALHVRRRRADGYHELETLFAFARDGDVVMVAPAERWSFGITGPFAADLHPHPSGAAGAHERNTFMGPSRLPPSPAERGKSAAGAQGEGDWADNLVTRAADAFRAAFPATPPHAITLDKRLPIASGIGGGSADAAATLRALARAQGIALDDPRLAAIALPLGADVPACLLGRTTEGSGVGEALTPIAGLPGTPLLLVNPRVAVSTAAVFRGWDGIDRGPLAPSTGSGDLLARARAGRNDLGAPARALAPAIAAVEALLAAAPGVRLSRMSGSGATCFALFANAADRDAAAAAAADARGWWTLATSLGE